MIFNPPLRRKGVEVAGFNERLHTISFIVHVHGVTLEIVNTLEYKAHISHRTREMVRYLEMEGYITPKQDWETHMGIIIHPPQDGNEHFEGIYSL